MSSDTLNGIPRVNPQEHTQWNSTISVRLGHWLATTKTGAAVWRRIGARLEVPVTKATGGRMTLNVDAPVLVLTSTGARTGQRRQTPLVYFTDADDVILTASNYGRRRHPGWYYNLLAHPVCELHVGVSGGWFRAREVVGPDRDRLFALAVAIFPGYAQYAQASTRAVPMLRLSPWA